MTEENQKILDRLNQKQNDGSFVKMPTIPVVLQTHRKTTEGNIAPFFVNCQTSERGFIIEDIIDKTKPYKQLKQNGNFMFGFTFAYDDELDIIALIYAKFDCHAVKKDETREWKEVERIYINREKNIFAKESFGYNSNFIFFNQYNVDFYSSVFTRLKDTDNICFSSNHITSDTNKNFELVYKLFPKAVTLSKNHMIPLCNMYSFWEFLEHKESIPKSKVGQKKIQELLKYELTNKSEYAGYIPDAINGFKDQWNRPMPLNINSDTHCNLTIVERVKCERPTVCLRIFTVLVASEECFESSRIYFDNKSAIACKKNNNGMFVYMPLYNDPRDWHLYLLNFEKDIVKGTMLEYFANIINEIPQKLHGHYIWALTKHPILEQLYKAGYKSLVNKVLEMSLFVPPDYILELLCGKINKKSNSIYNTIGMNKHQMESIFKGDNIYKIDSTTRFFNSNNKSDPRFAMRVKCILKGIEYSIFYEYAFWSKNEIKEVKLVGSINDIDDESTDKVIDTLKYMYSYLPSETHAISYQKSIQFEIYEHITMIWSKISEIYGLKTALNCCECIKHLFDHELEFYSKEGVCSHAMTFYRDYLNMIDKMELTETNKPYFKDIKEIKTMHDNMMYIVELDKNAYNKVKLKKAVETIKRLEYSDKDYMVIAPSDPLDFLKEGQELHHCVKIYLDRVINGDTNIMFVRKKEYPDVPFFTVEISNTDTIMQIHGLKNRNLNTEPDLIPFIEKWTKETGLELGSYNTIR